VAHGAQAHAIVPLRIELVRAEDYIATGMLAFKACPARILHGDTA
jgi:hypothetical protein